MDCKSLRNRKPDAMGSEEASHSVGMMTAAADAADSARTEASSWAEKPEG